MSNFNSLKNKTLQSYNRAMYAKTLAETVGDKQALAYLESFSKGDRQHIKDTMSLYKALGEPTFKRGLTSKLGVV